MSPSGEIPLSLHYFTRENPIKTITDVDFTGKG
jgi:hypothetical protein